MRQTRPLPDTHPEFSVLHYEGFTEYRVEHWRIARDGSGRIVCGTCVWSACDAVVLVLTAWVWLACFEVDVLVPVWVPVPRSSSCPALVAGLGIALAYLVWARCTQVLHESLLVFPTLGIQLETHRGHPLLARLATTRTLTTTVTHDFIPLDRLEDVVIHEGFRRWDVRFYLAALYRTRAGVGAGTAAPSSTSDGGGVYVRVAFGHVCPYFPVLHAVYLGVQETLFAPSTRVMTVDDPDGRRVDADVGVYPEHITCE